MRIFLFLSLLFFACKGPAGTTGENAFQYTISKNITAANGAVVSAHPLASVAGVDVLKKGGNAFDAAIATQLALAVVYPGAGNIGGGGFMVARRANGETISLDFRETAPAAAHKDMYLDSSRNVIPGKSIRGPGSSGVPGTVAGLFETMKFAKLSFDKLIAPAIELAEKGFVLTAGEAASLNQLQGEFSRHNTSPTAFQRKDDWKAGDTLVQIHLANTLKRIAQYGAKGFYEGETAALLVNEMKKNGGYVSLDDLKNYRAKWRAPHRFVYRGHEIVTMDLPSSGGILLHQMLGMLEPMPLDSYQHLSAQSVQLITEVERRAYADRAQYLGDPDFYEVPSAALTNAAYLRSRMNDFRSGIAGSSSITKAGMFSKKESEETTHLSIIDKEGNAVSVTTTLNDSYGSKTVVGGAGFLLNNEMDDFSIKPGEPNLYGAVGGEANAIHPGKRMLSSMSPTIVLKNNKTILVAGTPGGTTIPTSVLQTIINIIDYKLSTSDAVNSAKFHHQWLPDEIFIEPAFPDATKNSLEKMGYKISIRSSIGRTEVIKVKEDGSFEAVADNRGDDSAAGY